MMEWFNFLMSRLRALFRRESVLRDIEEELRVHVEIETETNIRRGMPPDEARAAALKSFGNLGRNTELGYDVRGGGWIETLWQDLRYGARMLMKNPGFTLIAVATLSLGIGANTAIFSVVNALLLRPLPYTEPDRLVQIWQNYQPNIPKLGVSGGDFQVWWEQTQSFAQMAAYLYFPRRLNLTGEGEPEKLSATHATANLFSMLGVTANQGRT